MSRFLKFIVHFVVICTILCVVALVVPPFLGITTEIQDGTAAQTNLPIGSVTYAIPQKTGEVRIGDPILVTEDSSVFRYNLASIDMENGRGTVIDPAVTNAEPVTVAVRDYVPKIVLEVPFLGYLMMATESVEGLVILGLAALFLIVLYIIAELWKHNPDPDDGYDDDAYRRKKNQAARRQARVSEETVSRRRPAASQKPRKRTYDGKIRTGGFVDEVDESDFEDEVLYEAPYDPEEDMTNAANEAHDVLRKEIAAATGGRPAGTRRQQPSRDRRNTMGQPVRRSSGYPEGRSSGYSDGRTRTSQNPDPGRQPVRRKPAADVTASSGDAVEKPQEAGRPRRPLKSKMPQEEVQRITRRQMDELEELGELAIPSYSAEELAKQAEEAGDPVDIVKDDITDVTLVDYSDLFANVDEDDQEDGQ